MDLACSEVHILQVYVNPPMFGHEQFAASNSVEDADRIDNRVEAALREGGTLDAKLILLSLHSGQIAPDIADRIDLDEA